MKHLTRFTTAVSQRSEYIELTTMDICSILLLLMSAVVGTAADVPVLTQYPEASDPYMIDDSTNATIFPLNCSVTLDSNANNPAIYWRSNREGIENISITTSDKFGVKAVQNSYDQTTGIIWSRLDLELTMDTFFAIRDTEWGCVVEYSTLDNPTILYIKSNPVGFTVVPPPSVTYCTRCGGQPVPVIGLIVGIIAACALVIVIGCLIYRRRKRQNREAGTEVENRMSFSTTKDKPSNERSEIDTSACTTLLEPESVNEKTE